MTWSKRRLKRDARYQSARRGVFERAGGRCELMITPECTGRCEQVHHKAGRNVPDPHRLELLIGCCLHCHTYLHSHVAESYERGWMVRRNGLRP